MGGRGLIVCALVACGARTELGGVTAHDAGAPPPDFIWYVLDETSGTTAKDSSPHHYDMKGLIGISWSDGGVFDGTVCSESDVGAAFRDPPITITAWLAPATRDDEALTQYALAPYPPNALSGDSPHIGGFGVGLNVWTNGGGGAAVGVETGPYQTTDFTSLGGSYSAGTEYFVASVVGASSATVFVNGVVVGTTPAMVPPPVTPTPLHLGCHNDDQSYGSKRFYRGRMRDVRMYERLLGHDEIAQLYASGPVTKAP